MAAPSTTTGRPKRVPAELYWNPSDPDSATVSAWGTRLGNFDNLQLFVGRDSVVLGDQTWGGEVEELITYQKSWITVLLRDFDKDALGLVFPEVVTNDTAALTPSLDALIADVAEIGGTRVSASAGTLLLRPRDNDLHPCVYYFNAAPTILPDNQIDYEAAKEWGFPIMFRAFVDSAGKKFRIGNSEVVGA